MADVKYTTLLDSDGNYIVPKTIADLVWAKFGTTEGTLSAILNAVQADSTAIKQTISENFNTLNSAITQSNLKISNIETDIEDIGAAIGEVEPLVFATKAAYDAWYLDPDNVIIAQDRLVIITDE